MKNIITDFTEKMVARNNFIDNTIYKMLSEISSSDPEGKNKTLEWDATVIGEFADAAEKMFREKSIPFCHPFKMEKKWVHMSNADGYDISRNFTNDKGERMCPYCYTNERFDVMGLYKPGNLLCGYKTCILEKGEQK